YLHIMSYVYHRTSSCLCMSTLFPYTTLFRSYPTIAVGAQGDAGQPRLLIKHRPRKRDLVLLGRLMCVAGQAQLWRYTVRKRIGIIRICSGTQLLFIGETIAVAVRITVITNAVTVKIAPLGGIVWEGIVRIRHAIPVSIIIQGIR